jgi:hypothetical protein
MRGRSIQLGLLLGALIIGCGGGEQSQVGLGTGASAKAKAKAAAGKNGSLSQVACKADKPDLESSEYDTSGDGVPDVLKVFRRIGSGATGRLVLICRESDLNGDGVMDVVRHYDDDGNPKREDADRNFDGKVDDITYYENGEVTHREIDTKGDGVTDLKIYYDHGKPVRAERDIAKRSTATNWKPDVWEYYEEGRIVRIGTDLDGDGRVDRWDRSDEQKRASIVSEEPTEPSGSAETESEKKPAEPSKSSSSGG